VVYGPYRRIGVRACERVGVWACGRVGVRACGRKGLFGVGTLRRSGICSTRRTLPYVAPTELAAITDIERYKYVAATERRSRQTPNAERQTLPGTIGAAKTLLMPAMNRAATQYPSHSLTTGLIAGSDLVIVCVSGVIKKYK
jgi:hypothetical protein